MGNEIKNLLDDITKDVNNSYAPDSCCHTTFDSGKFRERLSLYVLKDIVCAMLNENPEDVDQMVDNSIMKHIRDNYDGSCYGYLCHARDRLANPEMNVFGNIIQEIDRKCEAAAECAYRTKNPIQESATSSDVKEMLNGVENYDELREKLKKEVSDTVVNDVVKVITKSSEAPIFTDIDKKVKVVDSNENPVNPEGTSDPENDITSESFILKRIGSIISESAYNGDVVEMGDAYDQAIVEYAIAQMDIMTKARPKFLHIMTKFM